MPEIRKAIELMSKVSKGIKGSARFMNAGLRAQDELNWDCDENLVLGMIIPPMVSSICVGISGAMLAADYLLGYKSNDIIINTSKFIFHNGPEIIVGSALLGLNITTAHSIRRLLKDTSGKK